MRLSASTSAPQLRLCEEDTFLPFRLDDGHRCLLKLKRTQALQPSMLKVKFTSVFSFNEYQEEKDSYLYVSVMA